MVEANTNKLIDLILRTEKDAQKMIGTTPFSTRIMAIDSLNRPNLFLLPSHRPEILKNFGESLRTISDLESLVLIRNSFFIVTEEEELRKLKFDELLFLFGLKNGIVKISEIPKAYEHLRKEALIIEFHDCNENTNIYFQEFDRDSNGDIIYNKTIQKSDFIKDETLKRIWEGYRGYVVVPNPPIALLPPPKK